MIDLQTEEKKLRKAESARNSHFLRRYGITTDHYESLLEDQDYRCAICKQFETSAVKGKVRALAVDHCHSSGAVRGLLCYKCNSLLGYARDNKDLLRSAIDYLS